jgi:acyl-CoA synthetase (NDP forming)
MKSDRTINRLTADQDANIRERAINAVFRRAGVLRVRTLHDLFDSAKVLATQPAPTGPRLTIITNSNSAGQLALQELLEQGGEPASTDLESWISVRELAQQNQVPPKPD